MFFRTYLFPSCIKSNAELISSIGMVCEMNSSIFRLFFMYFSTSFGTESRLLNPPNAVPFQVRPVTSWNGRVLISWPAPATPTITLVPHPLWQASNAERYNPHTIYNNHTENHTNFFPLTFMSNRWKTHAKSSSTRTVPVKIHFFFFFLINQNL